MESTSEAKRLFQHVDDVLDTNTLPTLKFSETNKFSGFREMNDPKTSILSNELPRLQGSNPSSGRSQDKIVSALSSETQLDNKCKSTVLREDAHCK